MVYLLIAVVVVAVLLAMVRLVVGRDRRLDEVERFHRARKMTTGWSLAGVTRPPIAEEAAGADRDDAPTET